MLYTTIKRKKWASGAIACMLALALAAGGCTAAAGGGQAQPSATQGSTQAGSTTQSDSTQELLTAEPLSATQWEDDTDYDAEWDESSATVLDFDAGITASAGVQVAAEGITITQAGDYVLRGSYKGQIVIDAKDSLVRLILDGVALSNSTGAAIWARDADKTVIILAEGTENSVSDGQTYDNAGDEDAPDAAVFAQDDLTITGSGSLTVVGNYEHGIASRDTLCITGGTLDLTAAQDALRGRDAVVIADGDFTLDAGNDGIKSNHDVDADKGYILLLGGDYSITAANDAVQAETTLTIQGGAYTVVTGGGAAAAPERVSDERGGMWGNAAAQTQETESESMKGFKAGVNLNILDGTFSVDSQDDAFHSNGATQIDGGIYTISTGDDAFHADGALTINGGEIDIEACYEGLEGATVDINGGGIHISATDDCINAAGGSTDGNEAPVGRDQFQETGNYYIRITGGTLEAVSTGGDVIDSNGSIYVEGGTLVLNGLSRGMEGAFDCDGSFIVSGGVVAAAGSAVTPASSSTQNCVILQLSAQQNAGAVVALKDASGSTVAQYEAQLAHAAAFFTSPDLIAGQQYTIMIDGVEVGNFTQEAGVTIVTETGEAADNNMQGGPGGGRGQMPEGAAPEGGQMPGGGRGQRPEGMTPPEDGTAPEEPLPTDAI